LQGGLIAALILGIGAWADEPVSPTDREKLAKQALELHRQAFLLWRSGQDAEAIRPAMQALAIRERLYPAADYPRGHRELAGSLGNLGVFLATMGDYVKARPYLDRALAMNERLYPPDEFPNGHGDLARSLSVLGGLHRRSGEYGKALPYFEKALAMQRRLYPPDRFKDGHANLVSALRDLGELLTQMDECGKAQPYLEEALALAERLYPPDKDKDGDQVLALSINCMGGLHLRKGEYGKALASFEKALAMYQRLYPPDKYKDGDSNLASALTNLGVVLAALGEPHKALPYFERALAMNQRLYPAGQYRDGHPFLATSLFNLGGLLAVMGEHDKALPYLEKALVMREGLFPPGRFKAGHPEIARTLNGLAETLASLGKAREAFACFRKAGAMNERLYPPDLYGDGHHELANSLSMSGMVLVALGEMDEALEYFQKALAMNERLYPPERFKNGHPELAGSLWVVGAQLKSMGDPRKALPYLKRGLEIRERQAVREIAGAPEAQVLTLLHSFSADRALYLATALQVPAEPVADVYAQVWKSKGLHFQLMAQRHQAVLIAASGSAEVRRQWDQLRELRRQVNSLALDRGQDAPGRDRRLAEVSDELEKLERELARQLPELERHRRLAALGPADLSNRLAAGSAFIDVARSADREKGKRAETCYQAFILAPGRAVRRVDLGPAAVVDKAVTSWRRSLDRNEASLAPQKLKERVWDRLAAELPDGTKVVYLCPEGDLARLPWGALPGPKPGTILLEECSVAVVPSGKWLLEKLVSPPRGADNSDTLLAVGDVDYGKQASGAEPSYSPLTATGEEIQRVLEAFGTGDESRLRQSAATLSALKERLVRVRHVHLATHGYFDQPGLVAERRRPEEQLEQWAFRPGQTTDRVGLGAKNPLGYVGLALAGANDPERAGPEGNILTGLGIVDLPLENLRLCVLSACETGLGELTEGEGVIGLQRAFHVAGCPNVIGSLWKVNDAATAALMTQFYHELWANKRTPIEALREAQLTIYRHPERVAALAGERGRPALDEAAKLGSTVTAKPEEKPKTTPTKLWAAFVLSGVGR
jgi:CHAT domain-containing protein/tetratricopeptide (TPR) repeat protein